MKLGSFVPPISSIALLSGALIGGFITLKQVRPSAHQTTSDIAKLSQPTIAEMDPKARQLSQAVNISEISSKPIFFPNHEPLLVSDSQQEASIPDKVPELEEVNKLALDLPQVTPPVISYLGRLATGKRQKALIRDLDSGSEWWIELGELIEEWKLVEISHSLIVLRYEDQEISVEKLQ